MFDSCSAYQDSRGLLFLSHCVPNPPDKGEKIRAHHELFSCARRWPVHLVCFARSEREVEQALALRSECGSVYVELLRRPAALLSATARFAAGSSLTVSFYSSARMKSYVRNLAARARLFGTLAYSSAMAQYAPPDIPLVLDLVDVDSEKWMQYGESRRPGWLFRAEGGRLRQEEVRQQRRAIRTFVTTKSEASLFSNFAGDGAAECLENGVDCDFFDPAQVTPVLLPQEQRPLMFVGAMDYYPNVEAVCWFAANVFPEWKRRCPQAAFWIVGRNPAGQVRQLARTAGIHVTGDVPDVRPYFAASDAVVAPVRIARGIQNKVLEAMAMGKQVLVSPAVADCFGENLPHGVVPCATPRDYLEAILRQVQAGAAWNPEIRHRARHRFSWEKNLAILRAVLEPLSKNTHEVPVAP